MMLAVLIGLICISAASLHTHLGGAKLTSALPELAPPSPEAGMSLSEEDADELSKLMGRIKENPNDAKALRETGEFFVRARDWKRAEFFLDRAVLSNPSDIGARDSLGISQYQQGAVTNAAKTYEELLAIREDPRALYNLAIIYKYRMNRPRDARALLQKALDSPDLDAEIRVRVQREL